MSIEQYIESKRNAWAESTKRSELHRLNAVKKALDGNPETLWKNIEYMKPYSRLTTWTRVTEYWQYLLDEGVKNGPNPYKVWRKKNARAFKNVYEKTKPTMSYQEAKNLVETISDASIRRRAFEMLGSGTRYSESGRIEDGTVSGKGSKLRAVYNPSIEGPTYTGTYDRFRKELQKVGLKPHDLRKLFLSRVVELGANPFELAEIAGWSSIETASSYIKVNSNKMKSLVDMIHSS